MTVLGKDTFQRANQAGWGTASDGQTWAHARGAATWNIVSNEGAVNSNSGTFNVFTLGSQTPKDAEILVRVTPATTINYFGLAARYADTTHFYYADINNGTTAEIGRENAGFSTLASTAFSYSAGTAYWIRFRLVGTGLFMRVWADGSAEPSTWTVSATDATFTSGQFGIASDTASASNSLFDSFYVVDYANCENLSVSDSFLSTETAVLVESNSASDSLIAQGGATWLDLLSVADMQSALQSWGVDPLIVSDNFVTSATFLPIEALSATDSLLIIDQATWLDLLSVSDSLAASQTTPAIPKINVTMLARKGNVTLETGKGNVTLQARKGNVTFIGREQ